MHHTGQLLGLRHGLANRGALGQLDAHERAALGRSLDNRLHRLRVEGLLDGCCENGSRLGMHSAIMGVVELDEDFAVDHIGSLVVDWVRALGGGTRRRGECGSGDKPACQRRRAENRCYLVQARAYQLLHTFPLHRWLSLLQNVLDKRHRERRHLRTGTVVDRTDGERAVAEVIAVQDALVGRPHHGIASPAVDRAPV